jgi:Leucine-rich repeat (LRR) protein
MQVSEWKSLTYLDVSSNKLASMPNMISSTGIQTLLLYNNKISSPFFNPANQTKLKVYDVHDNSFFGPIPSSAFNQLGELKTVNVANNALTGALPTLSGSSEITSLAFAFNAFSGAVPGTWSALKKLVAVDLSRNQVWFQFSIQIGGVTRVSLPMFLRRFIFSRPHVCLSSRKTFVLCPPRS